MKHRGTPGTIWTLTVDDHGLSTSVHATEHEAVAALRRRLGATSRQHRASDQEIVDYATQHAGWTVSITSHEINLPIPDATVIEDHSENPIAINTLLKTLEGDATWFVEVITHQGVEVSGWFIHFDFDSGSWLMVIDPVEDGDADATFEGRLLQIETTDIRKLVIP